LKSRSDPHAMRPYLNVVPDLVWSVQPKISVEDRKQLIRSIPKVLKMLREGLEMIEWPQDRSQEFFKQLMTSHAHAVKAVELAHGHAVPIDTSTLRIKLDGMQISDKELADAGSQQVRIPDDAVLDLLAASQVSLQHHSMPDSALDIERAAEVLSDIEVEAEVDALRRGDWFDLHRKGRDERICLRWISPKQSFYLFVQAGSIRPHSLAPDTLREYLRRGYLKRVESTPLFERAVKDVMDNLQSSKRGSGPRPTTESVAA
jgi:Protein of unknown function (DUF1631)